MTPFYCLAWLGPADENASFLLKDLCLFINALQNHILPSGGKSWNHCNCDL